MNEAQKSSNHLAHVYRRDIPVPSDLYSDGGIEYKNMISEI